jgi:hypothetical protein
MPLSISHTVSSDFIITIADYKAVPTPDTISILLLLTIPSSPGLTTPLEIASYTSLTGNEIDKDVSEARITVLNIAVVNSHSVAI